MKLWLICSSCSERIGAIATVSEKTGRAYCNQVCLADKEPPKKDVEKLARLTP